MLGPVTRSDVDERVAQGRILWCDAEANSHRLSTRAGVADVVEKAKRFGINTIIVDVKPLAGEVLYKSNLAPRLGVVDGYRYPEDFDLLAVMIEEGHRRGIPVHAAINVFSEGHREWGRGPGYEHPEWQVTMYEICRTARLGEACVTVELVDPWEYPAHEPVVVTRRSGQTAECKDGRLFFVIKDNIVSEIVKGATEVLVPENGCILSLPESHNLAARVGDRVAWSTSPAFRKAAESKIPSWGIFVNPIGPVRSYELAIIEEIAAGYDVDGIVFDRMRYPNLYADFGDDSRRAFEEWLGKDDVKWPEDIFLISDEPWKPPVRGRYYKEWLEWRAWQIHDFAEDAATLARSLKPHACVAVYVGSWYESYFDVGVNWASPDFRAGYEWMTPTYHRAGFAHLFDYICTGCYYPLATREEARLAGRPVGATVEAACDLSRQAIGRGRTVYGSLYLRDYKGNPEAFRRALSVVTDRTDGVMLFDLVYLEDYDWWPILCDVFHGEAIAPHTVRRG